MKQDPTMRRAGFRAATLVVVAALGALAVTPAVWGRTRRAKEPGEGPRVKEEKTGTVATREGLRLHLVADLGDVRILTQKSDQVSYKVRIETDSRDPDAQNLLRQYALAARGNAAGVQLTGQMPSRHFQGHLWVSYEVTVPRNYNLDVVTQAGNIETQDIDGRVVLTTSGGNVTAGSVGGPEATGARLETQGGHITVKDVNGELRAITAGGHITVANVRGDAVLRTGGGHIRTGTIHGTAQLDTGGGNITVQRTGASVTASTGGGQIDFGEAAGSIRARTGGGGIRILHVAGPTQLETGGGSIFLTMVEGAVHASTGAGSITAWFWKEGPAEPSGTPKPRKVFAASQLTTRQGDIVVYLPRELAVTIEAIIEMAADHRIEADPSLPLKVTYSDPGAAGSRNAGTVRGECAMNGGGEVLRLRTAGGNIQLKLADTAAQLRLNQQQMEQLKRRLEMQQQRLLERHRQQKPQSQAEDQGEQVQGEKEQPSGEREFFPVEGWGRKLEEFWLGGVKVDADTQQRKLVHSVRPVYPDVARQAGIEGTVRLKAIIARDGSVQALKVISGEPALANAAVEAVRKWRYRPTVMEGKPVAVVTTVTVEFQLK